jgi:hypothetical protein
VRLAGFSPIHLIPWLLTKAERPTDFRVYPAISRGLACANTLSGLPYGLGDEYQPDTHRSGGIASQAFAVHGRFALTNLAPALAPIGS